MKKQSKKELYKKVDSVYLSSLTIENIKCFGSSQVLNLSDENGKPYLWNVILGENGLGKTTLLQLIVTILPPKEFRKSKKDKIYEMASYNFMKYNIFGFVRYGEKSAALNLSIYLQNKNISEISYQDKISLKVDKNSIVSKHFEESVLKKLVYFGYGASRHMGIGSLSENLNDTDINDSLFKDTTKLINAEEWLIRADYMAHRGNNETRFEDIKKILISLLPDVTDIRIKDSKKLLIGTTVEFKNSFGWVSLKSLSLGYRTLLSWIVDLAARLYENYPDCPNPLAEPAIVLVDEIDLHMHPRWQRDIISFLSIHFPKTQFIVTAHSPLIVQAAEDANIILLRKENDQVIIDNNVEKIKGLRVDQVLTSNLFGLESARSPKVEDAMKKRRNILVKKKLTEVDKKSLKEIEKDIELPIGETPEEIQAMDLILRAAKSIQTRDK